jgi:hypothetical protein
MTFHYIVFSPVHTQQGSFSPLCIASTPGKAAHLVPVFLCTSDTVFELEMDPSNGLLYVIPP